MAITKTAMVIDLNETINTIVTAVQFDTQSRYLDVYLYDKGIPIDLTGHQVRIHVRRKGITTLFEQGEITDATAGRCQFELKNKMLEEAGPVEAQISIWNNDAEILSTKVFKILVTESIRNDDDVEASNEFGVLVVLFTEIQNALELMHEMVDSFGAPGAMAEDYGVETFWGMLEHLAAGADVNEAIKTNVNSTMDTSSFVPLNQIVTGGNTNVLNSIASVQSFLNTLKNSVEGGGIPIIRHIQRGTVATNSDYGYAGRATLTGFTNLNKMFVLYSGIFGEGGYNTEIKIYDSFIQYLTLTELSLDFAGNRSDVTLGYQVIEFY